MTTAQQDVLHSSHSKQLPLLLFTWDSVPERLGAFPSISPLLFLRDSSVAVEPPTLLSVSVSVQLFQSLQNDHPSVL